MIVRLSVCAPVASGTAKWLYRHSSQDVCPYNVKFARALADDSPYAPREVLGGKDARTLARETLGIVPAGTPPALGSAEADARGGRAPRRGGPLRGVAEAVLGELERVLHAYVARLRSDPATPDAHAATEVQVEDHLASLLADLAGALHHLEDAGGAGGGAPPGGPTPGVQDATAIQRVVAERHGAQRARLGWSEQEVRREFTILREELAAAVRRRAPARVPGPTVEAREGAAERALEVLGQFLAVAERLSVESLRRALGADVTER